MKKIDFVKHILPHLVAVTVFLVTTIGFFSPHFIDDQVLEQHDIQQFTASAKKIMDYREQTGEEALWTKSMFGGMPTYLISTDWDNQPVLYTKIIMGLFISHPYSNIFLAFLCYYIMLLAFGIRPYVAIAGGLAFGLSSYMILGFGAGHNGRIGAIAFMPLVMAGIHLAFSNRKLLGFGVATMGLALHLRENHLQITYYLVMIAVVYGIIRLVEAIMNKTIMEYVKALALLVIGTGIAAGSFFGQFWAITEYTQYSIRGPSEIAVPANTKTPAQNDEDMLEESSSGLSKGYAFQYKYGVLEPMTLLIPSFYGGSSANYFVQDQESATYEALMQHPQEANQLAGYSSAYYGIQSFTAGPYYAGAIIVFLFVLGMLFADAKYIVWLVPLSLLSLMLSWGDSFSAFNYWMFDHFPGYNKFRSVNFALIIILFAMPLLGLMGIERLWSKDFTKVSKQKLLIAFSVVGGLCLVLALLAGMGTFSKPGIGAENLPKWFREALAADRASLFRMDALRSFGFITVVFLVLYFELHKRMTTIVPAMFIVLLVLIDLATVNKRYFKDESYKAPEESVALAMNQADMTILNDQSRPKDQFSYRVFAFNEPFGTDARTSYYHDNIGGYHGAKMKRYQQFMDSVFLPQAQQFASLAQQGQMDMNIFQGAHMLNVRYMTFGNTSKTVLPNPAANGNGWFVQNVVEAKDPTDELRQTGKINTRTTAVIDASKFKAVKAGTDSTAKITLLEEKPAYLKYKASTATDGLAVFSEIYYPKGWHAYIDGKEVSIMRANFILRALQVPAGEHTIEFNFKPDAYYTGNTITSIFSWISLLVLLGALAWSLMTNKKAGKDQPGDNTQVLDHNMKTKSK